MQDVNESLLNDTAGRRRRRIVLAVLLVVVVASIVPKAWVDRGDTNLYVHQARAFLNGRLELEDSARGRVHDIADYDGRMYAAFPPFPAVVLMPFVALLGITGTRVILVSVLLTGVNVFTLNRILKRLDLERETIGWLLVAFFLGTGYWLCVRWSWGVWFFAHVVAITCLLFAIEALLGKRRCLLAGIFLGLAFLSRQLSLWSVPFLAALVWQHSLSVTRRDKITGLVMLICPLLCAIAGYMAMNWVRFGSPLDSGYSYLTVGGYLNERLTRYGLFHPAYILFNFTYMFFQGPHILFEEPSLLKMHGMGVDCFGTSITFASPFVFVAFKARWKKGILWGAWITIGLALIHALFYMNNGWAQLNTQRFTMDFMPVLIVLVALGTKHVTPLLWKAAIVYAVILNAVFHFVVPVVRIVQERFL